ncbi:hypothetical protein RDI58_003960 [Solanum bulbocastanum]|uniref:Uncharacterized protein n=1 Tax=Solanum bulbocastanum TaxID=147425 RepID=A0AAN8U099_SOLBU
MIGSSSYLFPVSNVDFNPNFGLRFLPIKGRCSLSWDHPGRIQNIQAIEKR